MGISRWNTSQNDETIVKNLSTELDIGPLLANVLASRKLNTAKEAYDFFSLEKSFSSPFEIKDMQKAVDEIQKALENNEKITIYGDYDCDGITATVLLYTYLLSIGGEVAYYIPERDNDGYGLNKEALDRIKEDGTKLIITVDNGISALDEAEYAALIGLKLIITDHHQVGETLPNALAVVDPNREDDESNMEILAGVGVAFKLVCALEDGDYQSTLEYFSDLAAVGTIADVVPLVGENRILVATGLNALQYSENHGLNAMLSQAKMNKENITAQNVAFTVVPRINAAGRLNSAKTAALLLTTEDDSSATELAITLNEFNKKRHEIETAISKEAFDKIGDDKEGLKGRVLVVCGDNWDVGVIGIVSARLLKKYGKPVFLLSKKDGELTGSARSFGDFHLYKALQACSDTLMRFGGHKMAAGFSLKAKKLDEFIEKIEEYAKNEHENMPTPEIDIASQVTADMLNEKSVTELSYLEPCGQQNPQPIFLIKDAVIEKIAALSEDKHQKLNLKTQKGNIIALYFSMPTENFFYRVGDRVDLVVTLSINEFNGKKSVSVRVCDMRFSEFNQDRFFAAKACFEKIERGEEIQEVTAKAAMPTRKDIAIIYKWLIKKGSYPFDEETMHLQTLSENINFCKLKVILTALYELELIKQDENGRIEVCKTDKKVDLNSAPIFNRVALRGENDE